MKIILKVFNLSTIKNMNLILLLFQLLFKNIYCNWRCNDCSSSSSSTCPSDCKNSFYSSDKYFYCNGITSGGVYKYFYIFKYGTDNECHLTEKCPDKVVAETLECVPNCNNYYEVGD